MDRAERRRQARAEARRIMLHDGPGHTNVTTSTGQHYDVTTSAGQLPPKIIGVHRWVATAAYVVSQRQADAMFTESAPKYLDHESMFSMGVGCWDCEMELSREPRPGCVTADSRCPADG